MAQTKNTRLAVITALVIVGILLSYICQMSPAPFLTSIKDSYHVSGGDAVLNLAVSVIYPTLILASFFGSRIEKKIGTHRMYLLVLFFLSIGILLNYFAGNYALFLVARALFGIGFGLGIPFIGSVIMQLYSEQGQQRFNTINALFPFFGTLISFALLIPISNAFSGGWKASLGIWGFGTAAVFVLWMLFVNKNDFTLSSEETPQESHIYRHLLSRKEILLGCVIFMSDYFCYSYIVTVLPTMLVEQCGLSDSFASLMAALTFPGVGCIGGIIGGIVAGKSGKRKPGLILGMGLEVFGLLLCTLLCNVSALFVYIGIAAFAFGNGYWLPVLYQIPMDLPDMNPERVGASFAIMSIFAFICGFISPSIGGKICDMIAAAGGQSAAAHASGLRWSLFIFGIIDIVGFSASMLIRETGKSGKEVAE